MVITISKVTVKERQATLDYLYDDNVLLNAYAINRIQNKIHGKVDTYIFQNDSSFEIKGYLSTFEGLGTAIDIWIRSKSLEIESDLLNFFNTHLYPTKGKRKLFVCSNPRIAGLFQKKYEDLTL